MACESMKRFVKMGTLEVRGTAGMNSLTLSESVLVRPAWEGCPMSRHLPKLRKMVKHGICRHPWVYDPNRAMHPLLVTNATADKGWVNVYVWMALKRRGAG